MSGYAWAQRRCDKCHAITTNTPPHCATCEDEDDAAWTAFIKQSVGYIEALDQADVLYRDGTSPED